MLFNRPLRMVLGLLLSLAFFGGLQAIDLPEKHELDQRDYRRFVLPNGLKVLLVHDPKFNKSAAAMDIAVGSLSDPKEHQGLAHFLEHMLFLGTRKYPDEKDYHSYLRSRGGYHNAYTAGNHTNYHFQVHHEAFEGAIDRFAQFFIAPLFNPEFSAREIQAVHNEHQRNFMEDNRRQYQLMKQFFDPEHPERSFGTGNADTLKNVTPAVLRAFYEQHYSANRMALALLSSNSLDWMEQQVRDRFSEVPNRKLDALDYPEKFIAKSDTFRLVQMKPVKDLRQLTLIFPLPGLDESFRSQPAGLMGAILGHEGEGSLLSYFKSKNWATGLSAGAYPNTPNYATFYISVDLTPKGLEDHRQMIKDIFSGIEVLRRADYPDQLFEELRARQQLDKVFSDRGEGTGMATNLATDLNRYPMEWAENMPYSLEEKDPEAYRLMLDHLAPQWSVGFLMSQDIETDQQEEFYGTEYSVIRDEALLKATMSAQPLESMHLPKANPFMPEKAELLVEQPVLIKDEPHLKLYYLQDTEFLRPKVSVISRFKFAQKRVDLAFATGLDLALSCLREQLNELAYPASMAGVQFSIGGSYEGVNLTLSGYDDSLDKLMAKVLPQIKELTLDQKRFDAIHESSMRALKNFDLAQAMQHAQWASRLYRNQWVFTPQERAEELASWNRDRLISFVKLLWQGVQMESVAHGNLKADEALDLMARIWKELDCAPFEGKVMDQAYLSHQGEAESVLFTDILKTNNACYRRDVFLGKDDPRQRMISGILKNFIGEPFFSEMRTRQQLGYAVWGGAFNNPVHHYLVFIIQSGTHSADDVAQRANTFIAQLPKQFEDLGQEKFDTLKDALRQQLQEIPKSIHAKASRFFQLAFEEEAQFDLYEQQLEALESITHKDCLTALKVALEEKTHQAEWQLYAVGSDPLVLDKGVDIQAFREEHEYQTK